jgi:hypothetical protein
MNADTGLELKGDMNSEPELERSALEGDLIRAVSVLVRKSPDQTQAYTSKIEFDCTIPEIPKHSSVNLSVPLLHLQSRNFTMNWVVLDDQIPSIAFEDEFVHVTKIPIVKLSNQVQESFSKIGFDCVIPEIRTHSSTDLNVPLLRSRPGSFTMNRVVLGDQIPSISEEDIHLYIPMVNIQQSAPTFHKPRTENASGVPEHRVTTRATIHEQTTEEPVKKPSPDLSPGRGAGIPEESPDITHHLFGIRNDVLSTPKPKIIFYKELPDDNTLASFETFCLCAYREQVGGNPTFRPISRLDETIESHLDKWANPGQHLIRLDLDYFNPETVREWLKPENLRDFIGRSAVADYGFIIFKSRDEELLKVCQQLVQERLANEIGHSLEILEAVPRTLSIDEKREISSIFWGSCPRDKEESLVAVHYPDKGGRETTISPYDLDAIFNKTRRGEGGTHRGENEVTCRGKYEAEFSSFTKEENMLYPMVTRRGSESEEHYQMKCYVVRYLSEKYQLKTIAEITEAIQTEKHLESSFSQKSDISDVFDKKCSEYYEIETLFAGDRNGRGLINHLSETVLKYTNNGSARVYVVIDNIAAVRHMSALLRLEETFRDQEVVPVKFLTFNIASKGLIPIQEVKQKLQKIIHDKALMSTSGTP